jgi:uncharacterized protein YceH (UPF0502 family)
MDILLDDVEVRVLGSLMEKALSTPDHYPLSLNALTNACNQKSSRDPVVSYDEPTVGMAAEDLCRKGLVNDSNVSRVTKYEERFSHRHNLVPRETAALCVLLLRGPQTVGEIRTRTSRLCNFENLEEVLKTLGDLEEWGFVRRLARLPGRKESRYTHLLCGEPDEAGPETVDSLNKVAPASPEKIEQLELAVESLQSELDDLKKAFQEFKEQFD